MSGGNDTDDGMAQQMPARLFNDRQDGFGNEAKWTKNHEGSGCITKAGHKGKSVPSQSHKEIV